MKQLVEERQVLIGGTSTEASFGISAMDQAGIVAILRDRIYTNKPLAVLREYGANAWDAHREKGIPKVPFSVHLPTRFEPELVIRDYGPGLAESDVFTVYTQYGRSTKRHTNNAIGMLGIGCKSAFAYTSAFTVISYFGGKATTYAAYLDETKIGKITKMGESDSKETGIEIRVPVQDADFNRFTTEAAKLYPFFQPPPKINCTLNDIASIGTKVGNAQFFKSYREHSHILPSSWTAVMGGVPYRLNVENISEALTKEAETGSYQDLHTFVLQAGGIIYFDIGDVDVSASREEIEYTKPTIKNLLARFVQLRHDVESHILDIAGNKHTNMWSKRLDLQRVLESFSLSILKSDTTLTQKHVTLPRDLAAGAPKTFVFSKIVQSEMKTARGKYVSVNSLKAVDTLAVKSDTVLVIKDQPKLGERNFNHQNPIIVDPVALDMKFDRAELDALLVKLGIDGIPIRLLSNFSVIEKYASAKIDRRPHYSTTHFTYAPEGDGAGPASPYSRKGSDFWKPLDKDILQPDDVYVRLDRFEADFPNLKNFVHNRFLSHVFGTKWPVIHGVKIGAEPGPGAVHLRAWICAKIREGLRNKPHVYSLIGAHRWHNNDVRFRFSGDLPDDHIIRKYTDMGNKWTELEKTLSKNEKAGLELLVWYLNNWEELKDIMEGLRKGASKMRRTIFQTYPLLDPHRGGVGLDVLADRQIPIPPFKGPLLLKEETAEDKRQGIYLDYIKLIDSTNEIQKELQCPPPLQLSSSPTIPSPSTSAPGP